MAPLFFESTKDNPEVILDKLGKEFKFSGTSMPENAKKFFEPVFTWIEKYIENPNEETIVNFKMKYFNTASTKSLFDIMMLFKELAKNEKMLIINWYFPEEDKDMFKAGKGFSEMLRFSFNLIPYKKQ